MMLILMSETTLKSVEQLESECSPVVYSEHVTVWTSIHGAVVQEPSKKVLVRYAYNRHHMRMKVRWV